MTVHHGSNLVVTTRQELDALVGDVLDQGAFVFDVETRGNLQRHQDLQQIMEEALAKHILGLKNQSEAIREKSRARFEAEYRKNIAVDPVRNDLFWIGIGIAGRSWAIPMGHRHGELLEPEEIGDGSTVPPEGYRRILPSGRESKAKARYHKPAVFGPPPEQLDRATVLEALRPLFFNDDIAKVGHNVKFDARTVGKYYGELPPGPYVDTMLLQHYVNENLPSYSLERLIGVNYGGHDAYFRHGKLGKNIDEVSFHQAAVYLHLDVRWTWMVYRRLLPRLERQDLIESFEQEMDTLRVLMKMEDTGIPVDFKAMAQLGKELEAKLREIKADIIANSYPGFNPDSTEHKKKFIFGPKDQGNLGLKVVKYTKGGSASVDEEVLQSIQDKHPLIPCILEWQENTKLKGTYVDGLLPKLNQGKLHASFNLHRTATGRLSSSNPNLQNIPARGIGGVIRQMFVAPEGYELFVADYDQIELRFLAMYSQDPELLRIFKLGLDIHAGTAAAAFGKEIEDVTKDERQIGKMINFLSGYGGGAKLLAERAGIKIKDARAFLEGYHERFGVMTKWKRQVAKEAKETGYVTTMSGRRRRLPDINSDDDNRRARAERQAVNAIIQGSASDLCKKAMIDVDRLIEATPARLLVQVHDELVMTAPLGETEYYSSLLTKGMGNGTVIKGVPLSVECHAGHSWAEAKG